MSSEEEQQRRRHPRRDCAGDAEIVVVIGGDPIVARVIDLSVEGCRVTLAKGQTIPDDTKVELTFRVNQLPFRVWGVSKITRKDGTIGFHFPYLSKRVRAHLDDLVEELTWPDRTRTGPVRTSLSR